MTRDGHASLQEEESLNEKLHESEKLITNLSETWEDKLKKTGEFGQGFFVAIVERKVWIRLSLEELFVLFTGKILFVIKPLKNSVFCGILVLCFSAKDTNFDDFDDNDYEGCYW